MKIRDIRATTVAVPLKRLRAMPTACMGGPFIRTIVEVVGDDGLVGLGEMGGGGASAEAAILGLA
jgi:glucarate dehydratase